LQSQGVECIACDLLDQDALRRLPRVPNVVYMAGHKFGARGNPSFTWAMNAALPLLVADHFRASRIVALSTICVYPYSDASGPGASEDVPSQPPTGDYTNSCVGREQVFMHGSDRWGTAGRLVRLSYAIDMRYGVLHDIASAVLAASPLDVTMGYVNLIWQGDANEQILRLLAECTAPTSPINVTGPEKASVREIAEAFGRRFDRVPILTGHEADTAWIADTSQAQRLFGRPGVPLNRMIDWVADWVSRGGASFGKATHFETRDGSY
jgi:nucleoside-diphosphate-sugar epimerase